MRNHTKPPLLLTQTHDVAQLRGNRALQSIDLQIKIACELGQFYLPESKDQVATKLLPNAGIAPTSVGIEPLILLKLRSTYS